MKTEGNTTMEESAKNYNMPIGGGLWAFLHPEFTMGNPATEYNYTPGLITIPEFSAAKIGRKHNLITREKIREIQNQVWKRPGYRDMQSKMQSQVWDRPGYRDMQRKIQSDKWNKPGYKENQKKKQKIYAFQSEADMNFFL